VEEAKYYPLLDTEGITVWVWTMREKNEENVEDEEV
jgi:hypothetical protein